MAKTPNIAAAGIAAKNLQTQLRHLLTLIDVVVELDNLEKSTAGARLVCENAVAAKNVAEAELEKVRETVKTAQARATKLHRDADETVKRANEQAAALIAEAHAKAGRIKTEAEAEAEQRTQASERLVARKQAWSDELDEKIVAKRAELEALRGELDALRERLGVK